MISKFWAILLSNLLLRWALALASSTSTTPNAPGIVVVEVWYKSAFRPERLGGGKLGKQMASWGLDR